MSVSAQVTFVDLSAFSELDGFLYGGPTATTYFVGTVQKSNWFSLVPIQLRDTATPNFGMKTSSTINRTADYALHCWFRVELPYISLKNDPTIFDHASLRYTRKLGHNLFHRITLTHNELVAQEYTHNWLDMNYHFNIPASKRVGYRNMIGDVAANYTPVAKGVKLGSGTPIQVYLPFWFSVDSGRALPVAALPFNETRINYEFRNLSDVVVVYPGQAGGIGTTRIATVNDIEEYGNPGVKPSFKNPATYCMYAMVHNDERAKIAAAPRDILMHQLQQIQVISFTDVANAGRSHTFDIRISNSVIALYFAAENTSIANQATSSGREMSNYSTQPGYDGDDPIFNAQLVYENYMRLDMGSEFYAFMTGLIQADCIPEEPGVHMWSYALHSNALNPCGSTNYTKLANVSMRYLMSPSAVKSADPLNPLDVNDLPITWTDQSGNVVPMPQSWNHILIAKSHNIGRVTNGSFGFPTL